MNFEIIITTYNRSLPVNNLVQSLLVCRPAPTSIIVVDSSEVKDLHLQQTSGVVYIRSSHKNQPYQRYLGFLASKEEIVCFFDDDIQIFNPAIFEIILDRYSDEEVVGSSVKFINEGEITIHKELNSGKEIKSSSKLSSFLRLLSGVPKISEGKGWLAGLRGVDESNLFTETFSGPGGLSFRRYIVPYLFDDVLFSLFEKKMAMGEDKYISMGAIRFGRLAFSNTICIIHPANDSTYFQDITSFVRKEIYSRLFLSKRYLQVKQKWIGWAYIHFYWYALWRIANACMYSIFYPDRKSNQKLKGRLLGVLDTLSKPLKASFLCPEINWELELSEDLKKSGI